MKEHFSSRVTKLLVILALAIVASVMFVFVGCGEQHVHTWTQTKEQAATCTADGFIEYTCEGCGDVRQETVQATGHVWKDNGALQTHPATCTEDGYYYKLCTVCEYEETSSRIPANGHTMAFADVTVNLPTCTADGSVTGKCADCGADITWTADEIAAGAKLTGIPEKNVAATATTAAIEYYPTNSKGEISGGFLQKLDHHLTSTNTHTCMTVYDNAGNPVPGTQAKPVAATKYYWNYCDRCKTSFEVEEHTVPTGYLPCENAKVANSTKLATVPAGHETRLGAEYAVTGENYAYQCSECENYLKAVGHNYELMSLKSGEIGSTKNPPVWEAAPADAEFSCLYYEVCEWCGTNRISAPHKTNMAKPTCTEDVVCEVCNKVVEARTGHDFEKATEIFGEFKKTEDLTIAPSCVEPGYICQVCMNCLNREKAGQEVEWVLDENYKWVVDPKNDEAAGHDYETVTVYDTTVAAVGCARPTMKQDVCSVCEDDVTGHIRVYLKPTAYTKSGSGDDVVYTAVTENTLKEGGTYYIKGADGEYTKIANVANYNKGLDDNNVFYTDEEGYYDYRQGKNHQHTFFVFAIDSKNAPVNMGGGNLPATAELVDYERNASLKDRGAAVPSCKENGMVLQYCSDCKEYMWVEISLQDYLNGMNAAAKYGTEADQKFYPDYNTGVAKEKYHEGDMPACGHPVCSECKGTTDHEVQYTVMFNVTLNAQYTGVTAPTIASYTGWTCYTDDYDKAKLNAYIKSYLDITAETAGAKFTYTFSFKNEAGATVAIDAKALAATSGDWFDYAMPEGSDAHTGRTTIDVVATPVKAYTIEFESSTVDATIMANSAFADRIVYRAQTDKSQKAPVYGNNTFTFTKKDGEIIDFATYDWEEAKDVVNGVLTIYVA